MESQGAFDIFKGDIDTMIELEENVEFRNDTLCIRSVSDILTPPAPDPPDNFKTQ